MHIEEFGVEMWMNEWELKCDWNLAETCVESISIEQLLTMAGMKAEDVAQILPKRMTYGDIEGSSRLRTAIANHYAKQTPENIVITHGTIGANMLVHRTLVERGDRVVAVVPTYQQHYSIPDSIGAEVHQLKLREEDNWLPDLEELRKLASKGTKLIAINNPNNPTGALMDAGMLEEVVAIAREAGAWLLCDEVYRGTDQDGSGVTASIADLYEKGISTAGMSKAFSLAGLRLGWIAAPRELIEAVMIQRDYDTISVGVLDDHFAAIAMEAKEVLLERSRSITRGNLEMLSAWVEKEPLISWVKPKAGTTALLKFDLPMTSREFCIDLLKDCGVMFTPGSALGMEGYVRIGYANTPEITRKGLELVSAYLAKQAKQAA